MMPAMSFSSSTGSRRTPAPRRILKASSKSTDPENCDRSAGHHFADPFARHQTATDASDSDVAVRHDTQQLVAAGHEKRTDAVALHQAGGLLERELWGHGDRRLSQALPDEHQDTSLFGSEGACEDRPGCAPERFSAMVSSRRRRSMSSRLNAGLSVSAISALRSPNVLRSSSPSSAAPSSPRCSSTCAPPSWSGNRRSGRAAARLERRERGRVR